MSLASLITYYQGLLAHQYRTQPKARANIAIYAKEVLGDDLATQLLNAFEIESATGSQLDTIGKYIGVARDVATAPIVDFFGFWRYGIVNPLDQNPNGFNRYATPALLVPFYEYHYFANSALDLPDSSYRLLLGLKIMLNTSDNSLASIQQFLFTFFGGTVTVVDNKDMTMEYFVAADAPLPIDILEKFLPRPMGVGITVTAV